MESKNAAYDDQIKTYSGFIKATKYSVIAMAALLVILYVALV